MSLNKNKMVREIGRRTRLKNRDVQLVLETLIDVWTEELVSGGKIELEKLFVLETQTVDRGKQQIILNTGGVAPQHIRRVNLRASKRLKSLLNSRNNDQFKIDE